MLDTEWFVGTNGNYFRDMAGARYCVAHMQQQINGFGDWRWAYETARNGVVFGVLHPSRNLAWGACEDHARKIEA